MKTTLTLAKVSPLLFVFTAATFAACEDDDDTSVTPGLGAKDPTTAPTAVVDRFSAAAGMLMVRDASNGLPGANQPVDFDKPPFITEGLAPDGGKVKYYNFDVQLTTPAPIYVFFTAGASAPVPGQLNVIDVIPGDAGYSDFWQVNKVTVPTDYVANSVTSLAEITARGFAIQATNMIVNCPVVPDGSTATRRVGGGAAGLTSGWYKGMLAKYFSFEEKALAGATVPLSPIYVVFNVNPDVPGGGPGSGFKTEPGTQQTHNVVATLPSDATYSPLWSVNVYDNAAFDSVKDLATAQTAPLKGTGVANVNCPISEIAGAPSGNVPTDATALAAFLAAGTYKGAGWKGEAAIHPSAGPHGKVRTYVNQALGASMSSAAAQHPKGAASVKELYDSNNMVNGHAVMVKVADDGGSNDWYWYEKIGSSVVVDGTTAGLCTGCHSAGKDFVRTAPF